MTQEQLNNELEHLKAKALEIVRKYAPFKTGNLKNAIKIRPLDNGGFEVYIDTLQAPYAAATYSNQKTKYKDWHILAAQEFEAYTKQRLKGVK